MTDYATRMRNAPDDLAVLTTVEWTTWYIQHRHGPDWPWSALWAGERHCSDDPAMAREHEILAHQALDRGWGGPMEVRLVRKVETSSSKVELVPAMWEAAPSCGRRIAPAEVTR